jgi:hypothetical protein
LSKVTPDMLKSRTVFDAKGIKAGTILKVIREKYEKISADFIEIEIEKRIRVGAREIVKVRTRDAQLQPDGNVKVKYTKEELKIMAKEQELQRHPPHV